MSFSKHILLIVLLLTFSLGYNGVNAQTRGRKDFAYTVESLDGKSQTIYIVDNYIDNEIRIKCLNDSLVLDNTYNVEGTPVIPCKNFLEIKYAPRIGSNIKTRRVLFLCVNKGKLFIALYATYFDSFELTEVYDRRADSLKLFNEKSLYQAKLSFAGQNISDYKLIASIHDSNSSKHDPSTNFNHDDKTVLNFDPQQNIFYNGFENIDAAGNIWDPQKGEFKQHIAGKFPIIKLGRKQYYYIKGFWYEIGKVGDDENFLIADCYSLNPIH